MNKRLLVISSIGFVCGVIAGFLYSTGVKSQLSQSIDTSVANGKLTVSIDIGKAVTGGIISSIT